MQISFCNHMRSHSTLLDFRLSSNWNWTKPNFDKWLQNISAMLLEFSSFFKLLLIAKTNDYLLQERAMRKKNTEKSVNSTNLRFSECFSLKEITFPFLSLHTINLCFLKISQQPKGSISILIITFVLGIQRITDIDLYSSYISDKFRL